VCFVWFWFLLLSFEKQIKICFDRTSLVPAKNSRQIFLGIEYPKEQLRHVDMKNTGPVALPNKKSQLSNFNSFSKSNSFLEMS
jgi:hypothetical protein